MNNTCAPLGTKTCGVGVGALCDNGALCEQDGDCTSIYCTGNLCAAPDAASHQDGRLNAGESGIDCGGLIKATKLCDTGATCINSADCVGTCSAAKTCNAASATDGKKNNGETDIDCGGANAPKCAPTKACLAGTDCFGGFCSAHVCKVPTRVDGIVNGTETDVDCGGVAINEGAVVVPAAPRCVDAKTCGADTDCASSFCNATQHICVPTRSCDVGTAGINTCGKGEVGDPNRVHDSCCTSLVMPTRSTKRLDKYEITAGRFRNFLADVGPNVKAFVQAYVAAHPSSQLKTLTSLNAQVINLYPTTKDPGTAMNLVAQMGAIAMDNYDGIRGCYNGYGAYGHASYWQSNADLAGYGIQPRVVSQADLDAKSLNCVTPMMFAAFCAWDGGELPVLADYRDVWTAKYPWGAADINRPNYNFCNSAVGENLGGFTCGTGIFYEYPLVDRAKDISGRIAAPGRFQLDLTTARSGGQGWYDLWANFPEYTGDFGAVSANWGNNGFCDYSVGGGNGGPACSRSNNTPNGGTLRAATIPGAGIIGSSFEGHNYSLGYANHFPITFQYGKFGARCVRPK